MAELSVKSRVTGQPTPGAGAALLTFGGLAAAFGVASCCALPVLLATAGLGSAWLGGIALVAEPHRVFLLAAAAVCLTGGALLWWRAPKTPACTPDAICARPAARGLIALGLLLGFVLLYLGYTYV